MTLIILIFICIGVYIFYKNVIEDNNNNSISSTQGWQEEEKRRRLEEEARRFQVSKRSDDLKNIQREKLRQFAESIIAANDKLDPVIRLENPLSGYFYKSDIESNDPHISLNNHTFIRYDLQDNMLYIVEEREQTIFLDNFKRVFIHYAVSKDNMDHVIDILLKNKCTNEKSIISGLSVSKTIDSKHYKREYIFNIDQYH